MYSNDINTNDTIHIDIGLIFRLHLQSMWDEHSVHKIGIFFKKSNYLSLPVFQQSIPKNKGGNMILLFPLSSPLVSLYFTALTSVIMVFPTLKLIGLYQYHCKAFVVIGISYLVSYQPQ